MRDILSLNNHFTFILNVLNFVVLAWLILGCCTITLATSDNTDRDDTENSQGYFTRGITNYHLVHPVKILENGKRVTKLVSHFYEDDVTSEDRRKKREIMQHHELHYDVPLNSGKTLRLVLSPNHDLITPGLIVEHKNSESQFNVGKTRIRRASTRRCYYKGKIVNDPKSEVAISTCRGLAGFIRSNEGDYFIEPSSNYDPNDESHPHIVFRKGSDSYGNIHSGSRSSNCATKGNPTKLNKEDDVEEEAEDNLEDTDGNDEYRQQQRRYHSPKLEPVESIEGDDEEDDYEDEGEAEIDDEDGEGMEDNENQIYSREEIEKCKEVYKNNSYSKSGKNKCPNNNKCYDEDKKCAQTPVQKNKEDPTEEEDKEDEDEEEAPNTTQLSTTSKNAKKRKKNKEKHANPISKEEISDTSTIQQLFPKHKKFKISPNNDMNTTNNKNLVTKCKLNCKNNNNECCLDLANNNTINSNDNINSDYDEYNNNNNIKIANTNKRFKKFKVINNHQRNYNQNFKVHSNKKMKNYYHGKSKENFNNNDNEVYEVNTNDIANGVYDKPLNLKLTSKDVKRKHKISNLKNFYNNNNNNNRIHQKYSQNKRSRSKFKHDDYSQRSGGSGFDENEKDGLVIDFNPAVHFSSLIDDNDNDALRITNSSNNDSGEYDGIPLHDTLQFKNESTNEEEKKRKREIEYQSCKLPEVCKNHTECIWDLRLTIVISYLFSQRHKDIDIETYVLTVVNMISRNFQDDSLGLLLNVKIVRMVFIEYRMDELDEDKNKLEELFENFCLFQYRINPFQNKHPNHHDMGIYLISSTICSLNAVYGVASQSSVCNCQKTCIVAYDEGLLLGNILTHQLGHSLGAEHDVKGVEQYCDPTGRLMYNHMSAMISLNASQWSKCSAQAIRRFVRGPGSRCLRHMTIDLEFDWPVQVLAGQIYNPVQQCSLNFHMPMLPCYTGDFCRFLYCQVNENQCVSRLVPPAEGTICAADMWCIGGYCVTEGRFPNRVNGEWNTWGQWSPCTRSCGGGIQYSDRLCNNPPPKGGRYCPGSSRRHRICMTENCAPRAMSFRDLQCRETEDIPFRGMVYSWVAFFTNYEYVECSLVCESESGVVAVREMVVKDGTTCKPGTKNVCISGSCVDVGCDWGINSGAVADACGICHGNGTECKIIQGLYTEKNNSGYVPFMKVPKGSGMIYARELNPSDVHLVVSSFNQGIFYLNGPESMLTNIPMTGEVDFGSSRGMYNSMGRMERVFIQGPTDEDLIFFVKFNKDLNEGIRYQFAMPEVDPNYIPTYSWQFIDWEECSDACGGGQQFARAKCVEDKGGIVEGMYCTELTKPKDVVRSCNEFPCLPRWWVGSWSECLTIGNEDVRYRSVLCMRTRDANSLRNEILKDKFCCDEEKPESVRRCNETWMKCQDKAFKCDFDTTNAKFADIEPIINLEELNVRFTDDDSIKDEVNDVQNKLQALEDDDYVEDVNYDDMLDADLGKQGLNDISRDDARKFIKYLKDAENSPTIIAKETKGELKETETKKQHGTKSKSQSINQRNKQSKIVKDNTTAEDGSNNTDYDLMSAPRKIQLKKLHEGESQHNKPIIVQNNKMKVSKLEREGMVGQHTGMNYTNVSIPAGGFTLQNVIMGKSNVVQKSSVCNRPTTCPPKLTTCSEKHIICNVTECDLPLKCPPASAPLKTVLDQIILSEFKISVIPVMCEGIRYRPTDHDYETFHETTSWAVGQDKNRTILVGQKALLFLLQARKNMTRVPFIFHAEN